MSPRQTAIHLWNQHSTCCFDREETLCLMHGIVLSTPDLYLMAIPVHRTMTDDQIYRNTHLYNPSSFTIHSSPFTIQPSCPPRHLPPCDMLHIVHIVGSLPTFSTLFRESAACRSITHLCYHRWKGILRRVPVHKILRQP